MQEVDYIIVGQGIAGSLVAFKLLSQGNRLIVFDPGSTQNATSVSSGIINPITGRKLVKSWMYAQLKTAFLNTYKEIEDRYQQEIIREAIIVRHCTSIKDENLWQTVSLNEPDYCISQLEENPWIDYVQNPAAFGGIRGYKVDTSLLTDLIRTDLCNQDAFMEEPFEYNRISFNPHSVEYKAIQAKKVIFCDGWQAKYNPYFDSGLLEPAKGEVLIVQIPDVSTDQMLKHGLFIVPHEDGLYWVGSTYAWNQADPFPSKEKYDYLYSNLAQILKVDFTVIDHLAAIRPSSQDRRPIVMKHDDYPQLVFFNGLGTKGISLAPYFSNELIQLL